MSGFVKLDARMLDSSTWMDTESRDVFITCLLLARPKELRQDMPQLDMDTGEPTGWVLPAGWWGFVEASPIAIAPRALVPQEDAMAALRKFQAPEAASRSQEWEGRRVVRVNGGLVVLNYMRNRDQDHTAAERSKRWRAKQKRKRSGGFRAPTQDVYDSDGVKLPGDK